MVTKYFSPNQNIDKKLMGMLAITQVVVALMLWFASPNHLLPSPVDTIQAFPKLWNVEGVGTELVTSLVLNAQAIFFMLIIFLTLSYLTVVPFFRPIGTFLSLGRFNGFVGLPLIFTLIFGSPHTVKVALLVFGMGVYTVQAVSKLIENIPKEEFDHARTLRMGEWRVVWEVVILGHLDEVIDILRTNIAMGWMMLPMVEGRFRSEGGIGALLMNQDKHFALESIYAIQILVCIVGLIIDYGINVFKNIVCPHANLGLERN